jgi:hypothetical protein
MRAELAAAAEGVLTYIDPATAPRVLSEDETNGS